MRNNLVVGFGCLWLPILPLVNPVEAQLAVNSPTAVTLYYQGSMLQSRALTVTKSTLLEEGKSGKDTTDGRVTVRRVPTTVAYGLNQYLTLVLTGTYVDKSRTEHKDGKEREVGASGLGDTVLAVKYRFLKRDGYRRTLQLAAIAGVKLPTGSDSQEGPDGLLPPPLQPGSGSLDYILTLGGTQILGKSAIHASLGYRLNTQGGGAFAFGDVINYNLAFNHRVWQAPFPGPELGIGVELNGVYAQKAQQKGVSVENTGGNTLFASPYLFFAVRPNFTIELGAQFPLIQSLNGTQLGTDRTILAGFRYQYAWL